MFVFLRSLRSGNWKLHQITLEPCFFPYERISFSSMISLYFATMDSPEASDPQICQDSRMETGLLQIRFGAFECQQYVGNFVSVVTNKFWGVPKGHAREGRVMTSRATSFKAPRASCSRNSTK